MIKPRLAFTLARAANRLMVGGLGPCSAAPVLLKIPLANRVLGSQEVHGAHGF